MDRTKVAGDQKDDIVEIGIVVETTDPRLVGRARVGGRRERQDCRSEKKTNEAPQNHGARLNEPRRQRKPVYSLRRSKLGRAPGSQLEGYAGTREND